MNDDEGAAYSKGEAAFHDGKSETDNPYSLDSQPGLHMSWNDGFEETAEAADEDDGA